MWPQQGRRVFVVAEIKRFFGGGRNPRKSAIERNTQLYTTTTTLEQSLISAKETEARETMARIRSSAVQW